MAACVWAIMVRLKSRYVGCFCIRTYDGVFRTLIRIRNTFNLRMNLLSLDAMTDARY